MGSYDDYVQCGIPRSTVREDLDRVLAEMDCPLSERSPLSDAHETTRDLFEAGRKEIARRTGMEESATREFLNEVEVVYEDEELELGPSVRLTNCYCGSGSLRTTY